ncbi:o-succinylbenzoate synthase [Chromatium okenii]|uniref:o-succinylbenzoate synthase n=1 Tax=Chromatium okenii TaxID=61644 RepID=A0A2S7XQN4_9GAMM|nr:o-succinylbenzoate synthase [Chromatium okenii]PQJ95768.1 o-succinylbenzoate synthase [Chromatium okenii]
MIAYDLPLHRHWATARGGFNRRCGWLVQLRSADDLTNSPNCLISSNPPNPPLLKGGFCLHPLQKELLNLPPLKKGGRGGFYGDCAPLAAAGTETPQAAAQTLLKIQKIAIGHDAATLLDALEPELTATPAVRFAVECALLDLLSQERGLTLRHFLAPTASNAVPVNAMLGALSTITPNEVHAACAAGFKVLKIKVGLHDPATELAQLTALAQLLPLDVTFRLDANGAWEFDAAQRMLDGLAQLPIESLEEPLRQPNAAQLATLQQRVIFPLARDESLHGVNWQGDLNALGVRRLVLKPAAIGGVQRTLALAQRAQAAGIEVVITSVIESAAGLWATAQLAAASASAIPHGLATADWLAADLGAPPLLHNGQLLLPPTLGTGFHPHLID